MHCHFKVYWSELSVLENRVTLYFIECHFSLIDFPMHIFGSDYICQLIKNFTLSDVSLSRLDCTLMHVSSRIFDLMDFVGESLTGIEWNNG